MVAVAEAEETEEEVVVAEVGEAEAAMTMSREVVNTMMTILHVARVRMETEPFHPSQTQRRSLPLFSSTCLLSFSSN